MCGRDGSGSGMCKNDHVQKQIAMRVIPRVSG